MMKPWSVTWCGSRAPPWRCDGSESSTKYAEQKRIYEVSSSLREFESESDVPCVELERRCDTAYTCFNARVDTMQCFRGGDPRHQDEARKVETTYETCVALLEKRRDDKKCHD